MTRPFEDLDPFPIHPCYALSVQVVQKVGQFMLVLDQGGHKVNHFLDDPSHMSVNYPEPPGLAGAHNALVREPARAPGPNWTAFRRNVPYRERQAALFRFGGFVSGVVPSTHLSRPGPDRGSNCRPGLHPTSVGRICAGAKVAYRPCDAPVFVVALSASLADA